LPHAAVTIPASSAPAVSPHYPSIPSQTASVSASSQYPYSADSYIHTINNVHSLQIFPFLLCDLLSLQRHLPLVCLDLVLDDGAPLVKLSIPQLRVVTLVLVVQLLDLVGLLLEGLFDSVSAQFQRVNLNPLIWLLQLQGFA
jgi:hypothetical protein